MNYHFHDVLSAFQSLLPSQNVHFLLIFQLVPSDGCRVKHNPPVSASKRLSSFVSLCDDLTEMVDSAASLCHKFRFVPVTETETHTLHS